MDLGITIIGTICVALCAIPFIITNRTRAKKKKELLLALRNVAEQHQGKVTEYEICGNYAIGVDKVKNTVSFVSSKDDVLESQFADLTTIRNCEIVKNTRLNANKSEVIDQLSLKLSTANTNESNIILEFYNAQVSFQFSGEIASIEKWNKLINGLLTNMVK